MSFANGKAVPSITLFASEDNIRKVLLTGAQVRAAYTHDAWRMYTGAGADRKPLGKFEAPSWFVVGKTYGVGFDAGEWQFAEYTDDAKNNSQTPA